MIIREYFQSPINFLGLPEEHSNPAQSQVWVLPIPYEATTTYGVGTRHGPAAIVTASRQVELYDQRRRCEPASILGFYTLPPLEVSTASAREMISRIEAAVESILDGSPSPRLLVALGGEHSISAGVAKAFSQRFGSGDVVAVQIDAHADLREEYEGSQFSHACAGRRICERLPLFQIGIRNLSQEEDSFRRESPRITSIFAEDWREQGLAQLAAFVKGKTVYLTIDLDGLDPSIMPAVGTPEPGGLTWVQLLEIIRVIATNASAVPVMDVVELAPIPGMIAPDFLAAKLIYWAAADFLLSPTSSR